MNQIMEVDRNDINSDSDENVIVPQRYIPFDVGCSIHEEDKQKIKA